MPSSRAAGRKISINKACYIRTVVIDITEHKRLEEEREKLVREFQESLAKIKNVERTAGREIHYRTHRHIFYPRHLP